MKIENQDLKNYTYDLEKVNELFNTHDKLYIETHTDLIELKYSEYKKTPQKKREKEDELRAMYKNTKIYKYLNDVIFPLNGVSERVCIDRLTLKIKFLDEGGARQLTDKLREIDKAFIGLIIKNPSKYYDIVMDAENYIIDTEQRKINVMKLNQNTFQEQTFTDDTIKKGNEIFKYLKSVICSNEETDYKYLIDLISCYVQNKQSQTILYLVSIEGTGKSFFCDALLKRLLEERINTIDTNLLNGRDMFNEQMIGINVAIVNELARDTNYKELEKNIKDLSTNPTITLREMRTSGKRLKSIINFVITTNYINDLPQSGRRIFSPPVSFERKGDNEYFEKLNGILEDKNVLQYLFNFFYTNSVVAPMREVINETKMIAKEQATKSNSVYYFVMKQLLNPHRKKMTDEKNATELHTMYEDFCLSNGMQPFKLSAFGQNLTNCLTFRSLNGRRIYDTSYNVIYENFINKLKLITVEALEDMHKNVEPLTNEEKLIIEINKLKNENELLKMKIMELEKKSNEDNNDNKEELLQTIAKKNNDNNDIHDPYITHIKNDLVMKPNKKTLEFI